MRFVLISRLEFHGTFYKKSSSQLRWPLLFRPASHRDFMFVFFQVNRSIKARDMAQIESIEIMEFQAQLSLNTLYSGKV